ncbi:hypothetical protein LZ554_008889 [Drepanopeziza brunnea f. sp. 'monogermtubi']|nr:hypothetical protein LZ554_008889 [Drepanopeziza brunnea f. sp. 'monogermtubi']
MATTSRPRSSTPRIIQWFIDTRPLWPVPKQANPRDEVSHLKTIASEELSLLSESEQSSVLRYYHIRDAKTKLASHLLKHYFVTLFSPSLPWADSIISQETNGKPFHQSSCPERRLDFNVSHQAGLVSLIGAVGFEGEREVGTDIVCVGEREKIDCEYIDREGLFRWIDMHGEVFSESELSEMRLGSLPLSTLLPSFVTGSEAEEGAEIGGFVRDKIARCQRRDQDVSIRVKGMEGGGRDVVLKGEDVVRAKVRRFYAFWCLREAYVKMTGEALAAPWLKQLEIQGVRAPKPGNLSETEGDLKEGEKLKDFRITFKGKKVTDVKMELSALGSQYMIAGAMRIPKESGDREVQMGAWVKLDLRDILDLAAHRR